MPMFSRFISKSVIQYTITASLLSLLVACGGGGEGNPTSNLPASIAIRGSVGDGPVSGATITVLDTYGTVIATTISDETANYTADIPSNAAYPLIILANGGTDMVSGTVPDFEMISLVNKPSEKNANINPHSTMIVKTAQSMPGGLNSTNLDLATQLVLKHVNFGLDRSLVQNPITTTINELNIATMVKSSEVLAEMLRRTRKSLLVSGNTISEDDIIDSLAVDLADGFIDGAGQTKANALIAATVNVVSGQVLIESLNNNLNVNGSPATALMNNAIRMTTPDATDTTRDARITKEILDQTKIAVNAALLIDPTASLADVTSALDTISPGATSEEVDSLLLADKSADFDDAVIMVAYATDTDQEDLNTATRLQIESTQAPMLSLTASQISVETNGNVTLTWASSNSTSCVASSLVNWNNSDAISGEEMVGPLDTDTTFILTCSNNSPLITSKSVTIKVTGTVDTDTETNIPSSSASTAVPAGSSSTGTSSGTGSASSSSSGQNQTNNTGTSDTNTPNNTGSTASSQRISLQWNPNPGSIVGYIVYFGATSGMATTKLLDILVTSTNFDPQAPLLEIDSQRDLGMISGDNACFTVIAYDNEGPSSPSPAVCSII